MTELPIPILILLGVTCTMGVALITYGEVLHRQYSITAYILWTLALVLSIGALLQGVAMTGITMFFAAAILIIVSIPRKLRQ